MVSASTVQVEHQGKHYAFCCAECKPAFDKDPAKYMKKITEADKAPAKDAKN